MFKSNGLIKDLNSLFGAPLSLVSNLQVPNILKDLRIVIDYGILNKITIKDYCSLLLSD
jgi:hypothetical protein